MALRHGQWKRKGIDFYLSTIKRRNTCDARKIGGNFGVDILDDFLVRSNKKQQMVC